MTIPRIYSPDILENAKSCKLGPDNLKYLKQVLRFKKGDGITVFDGFGNEYEAVINGFSSTEVSVELKDKISITDKKIKIILAQAISKAGKMDLIVRNAAELGADIIVPFEAKRSVSRIPSDKSVSKAARWQKIAQEAARCCRSSQITEVMPVTSFAAMLNQAGQNDTRLIFWEEEQQKTIKDVLTDETFAARKSFFIIVGPEGGFSRDEVRLAKETGFVSVSLGRQILKVETAAAAIITIIQYEKGIFSNRSEEVK